MSQVIVADNWSLQDVSHLLNSGIDAEEIGQFIVINKETKSHDYKDVPRAVIAIEALFDLMTDFVLRDEIWVDEAFIGTWSKTDGPLTEAVEQGVVKPFRFLGQPQELNSARDEFVSRMCATESLKKAHEQNVLGWAFNKTTPNRYLSQILWGGAGMLARALVYQAGYTPHPVRRRLFQDSGIALRDSDAVIRLTRTINEKRASIYAAKSGKDDLLSLQVRLPPLPVKIIRESKSPEDLIKVALQLRSEYAELRGWLTEYQESLGGDDFADLQKHQAILRSISQYVDSLVGTTDSNAASFTVGIDVLKIAFKGDPLNTLKNQFGVRSMINKLVTTRSGDTELERLLGFFGHRTSGVGLKVLDHFAAAR
jgi:hypothetical protein